MNTRTSLIVLSLFASGAWFSDAGACGDKFIVGPGGERSEQATTASTHARILIYRDVKSDAVSGLNDPDLVAALTDAGHTTVTVEGEQDLDKAMKGGTFDLVLVDYSSAQKVRDELVVTSSHPSVVPVLDRTTRKFLSAARSEFKVVMNVPAPV